MVPAAAVHADKAQMLRVQLAASPPMYHPSGKVSKRSPGTAKQFSKNAANSPRLNIHQTSMGL
jgi:hypothetical protein